MTAISLKNFFLAGLAAAGFGGATGVDINSPQRAATSYHRLSASLYRILVRNCRMQSLSSRLIDIVPDLDHHARMSENGSNGGSGQVHPQYFWLWVMCLTGVDYFSTLGYQPSIAFETTGLLGPLATVVLVLI